MPAVTWLCVLVLAALACPCASQPTLLSYYGNDYPGDQTETYSAPATSTDAFSPLTLICSEGSPVAANQTLLSIDFVYDPTNGNGFPSNIYALLGLYQLAQPGAQDSTHFLVLAANGNQPYVFAGYNPALNNPYTFTAFFPLTDTVNFTTETSANAYAACVAFSGYTALYYGSDSNQADVFDSNAIDANNFTLPQKAVVIAPGFGANAVYFVTTPSPTSTMLGSSTLMSGASSSSGGSGGSSTAVSGSSGSASSLSSPPFTSSTASGAAYSDPYFHGFWNQPYYVHGQAGSVYSLLSDQHVQLNSRFVFLSNVSCPELADGELRKVHCSSHPGTYFGELGLMNAEGARLHIGAGDVATGFSCVTVNGQPLAVGRSFGTPLSAVSPHQSHRSHIPDALAALVSYATSVSSASPADHPARSSLYVHRLSARSLVAHVGLYELLIENSDRYVDLVQVQVTDWDALLHTVQPSGLMGASWNNSAPMPPEEELHRERDNDLMGCNTASDKHRWVPQQR